MNITVYSRTTCSPCQSLKKYLTFKQKSFKEVDVDSDPEAMHTVLKLSGYAMVPMTIIEHNDKQSIISGYNLSQLANLLK